MPVNTSTKRVLFRGEMRTIDEIASTLGIRPNTVKTRLFYGRALDAPKAASNAHKHWEEPPCCDHSVRYAKDIECRVARLVCGGECTQQEIALLFNTTHQWVSQIEERAIAKLRAQAEYCSDARELVAALDELRGDSFTDRMERESIDAHEDFSCFRRSA